MTYAVVWSVLALQAVTRIEQAADDPAAVRAAQDRIDFQLRRMARDLGESREPNFRLWYEDVLGVFYRIDETAMRVEVLFAGPSRRR
ncbi:MAG: hypothetical protein J0I06_06975 [Planctomycetes bacterium]|nr:hypothetical protein [Planctomycetota bacterium]